MTEQKIYEVDSWHKFMQYVAEFKIPPEVYGVFFMVLIVWFLCKEIKASPDLQERWHRFLATILSKKYFAWAIITIFFWYDHFVWQYDGLSFQAYLLFTAATFSIDVWQKKIGLDKKEEIHNVDNPDR